MTATVERRAVVEPAIVRGRVIVGTSVKVVPPIGATGDASVVTAVLAKKGQIIKEGKVLLELSGSPVFAMVWRFPSYRDISAGMSGPDVREMQTTLRRLGYRPGTRGVFDAQTQKSLVRFYEDRGYEAPRAEMKAEASPSGQASVAPETVAAVKPEVMLPKSSVVVLARSTHRVTKVAVKVGTRLTDPDRALFELDGAASGITAVATKTQSASVVEGQVGEAYDDLTGEIREVTVVAIGQEPVTDADGNSGFPIRLNFVGEPLNAPNRSLKITLTNSSEAREVLAVPVTAVFSKPDGTTFVTLAQDGKVKVDIAVKVGRIAGGWAEIVKTAPSGRLQPGTHVVVGLDRTVRP
ncbi:peptidoglycan-binding protein [Micromonospora sp. URMC 107]